MINQSHKTPLPIVGLVIQGSNNHLNKKSASPFSPCSWTSDSLSTDSIHSHILSTIKEILRLMENLYWIMDQEESHEKITQKLGNSHFAILRGCSRNIRIDIRDRNISEQFDSHSEALKFEWAYKQLVVQWFSQFCVAVALCSLGKASSSHHPFSRSPPMLFSRRSSSKSALRGIDSICRDCIFVLFSNTRPVFVIQLHSTSLAFVS